MLSDSSWSEKIFELLPGVAVRASELLPEETSNGAVGAFELHPEMKSSGAVSF